MKKSKQLSKFFCTILGSFIIFCICSLALSVNICAISTEFTEEQQTCIKETHCDLCYKSSYYWNTQLLFQEIKKNHPKLFATTTFEDLNAYMNQSKFIRYAQGVCIKKVHSDMVKSHLSWSIDSIYNEIRRKYPILFKETTFAALHAYMTDPTLNFYASPKKAERAAKSAYYQQKSTSSTKRVHVDPKRFQTVRSQIERDYPKKSLSWERITALYNEGLPQESQVSKESLQCYFGNLRKKEIRKKR